MLYRSVQMIENLFVDYIQSMGKSFPLSRVNKSLRRETICAPVWRICSFSNRKNEIFGSPFWIRVSQPCKFPYGFVTVHHRQKPHCLFFVESWVDLK